MSEASIPIAANGSAEVAPETGSSAGVKVLSKAAQAKADAKAAKMAKRASKKSEEAGDSGAKDPTLMRVAPSANRKVSSTGQSSLSVQPTAPGTNNTPRSSSHAHAPVGSSTSATSASAISRAGTFSASALPSKILLAHLDRSSNPTSVNHRSAERIHEIHPMVNRLAFQIKQGSIIGATARTLAMLAVFKILVCSYRTPTNNHLSRNFNAYLSPQINHLVQARPLAVPMANAITGLKRFTPTLSTELSEAEAKEHILFWIDNLIRERFVVADEVIQTHAISKIKMQDEVILTYGRSSIVEKTLIAAHEKHQRRFSVIIADSRPMLEGKKLLQSLVATGIPCTYILLSALPAVIEQCTLCLMGTAALLSNGAVYSRAGTASIAMMAKTKAIPVLICCETIKFKEDRVGLNSISDNELGPSDHLSRQNGENRRRSTLGSNSIDIFDLPSLQLQSAPLEGPQSRKGSIKPASEQNTDTGSNAHVTFCNLLYDVTPPSLVSALVTEVGIIPSSAARAVGTSSLPEVGH